MQRTGEVMAARVASVGRPLRTRVALWGDLLLAPVAWALDTRLVTTRGPADAQLAAVAHLLFAAFAVWGVAACARRWRLHSRLEAILPADREIGEDAANLSAWGLGLGVCFTGLILAGLVRLVL